MGFSNFGGEWETRPRDRQWWHMCILSMSVSYILQYLLLIHLIEVIVKLGF